MENKQLRGGAWKELIQELKTNISSVYSSDALILNLELSGPHFDTFRFDEKRKVNLQTFGRFELPGI